MPLQGPLYSQKQKFIFLLRKVKILRKEVLPVAENVQQDPLQPAGEKKEYHRVYELSNKL
jgi:hypothetical protein